jgi:nucleotide-binding universal stress UspA family protein
MFASLFIKTFNFNSMKTILVPVNFTDVSKNAAQFALQLAKQLNCEKVVLYNAYEVPIPQNSDPMGIISGPLSMYDVQEFKAMSENGLAHLKDSIIGDVPTTISLEILSEYGGMTTLGIGEVCKKTGADLMIAGTSDDSFFDDSGSDAIHLAKSTTVPLIAVPYKSTFKTIKNIVLACDLKKVAETVPVGAIKKILDETQATFSVLHIQETDDKNLAEEELVLHEQFDTYNPQYHYVKNPEFTDAINAFVDANNIDLIITIPKKHGWLDRLFKTSHLKALAFHSHVPLLMLHD